MPGSSTGVASPGRSPAQPRALPTRVSFSHDGGDLSHGAERNGGGASTDTTGGWYARGTPSSEPVLTAVGPVVRSGASSRSFCVGSSREGYEATAGSRHDSRAGGEGSDEDKDSVIVGDEVEGVHGVAGPGGHPSPRPGHTSPSELRARGNLIRRLLTEYHSFRGKGRSSRPTTPPPSLPRESTPEPSEDGAREQGSPLFSPLPGASLAGGGGAVLAGVTAEAAGVRRVARAGSNPSAFDGVSAYDTSRPDWAVSQAVSQALCHADGKAGHSLDATAAVPRPSSSMPLLIVKSRGPDRKPPVMGRMRPVFAGSPGAGGSNPPPPLPNVAGACEWTGPGDRAASPDTAVGAGAGAKAAASAPQLNPRSSSGELALNSARGRVPAAAAAAANVGAAACNRSPSGASSGAPAEGWATASRSPSPAVGVAKLSIVGRRRPAATLPVGSPATTSVSAEAPGARSPSPQPQPLRSASLPADEADIVVNASKYTFDATSGRWSALPVRIRVLHPNRGLAQGSMRVVFEVDELDDAGISGLMVAKMFRHDIKDVVEADYFNEGEAQCLSRELAERFTNAAAAGAEKVNISFLPCTVVRIAKSDVPDSHKAARKGFFSYRTRDSRDLLFCMEPYMGGHFTKYTNNFGGVYATSEISLSHSEDQQRRTVLRAVEAFSHFTLVESGGAMLVCDLQGVNGLLTDPQIHTADGKGFGMGNMGQEGIDKWEKTHFCRAMCKSLNLPPVAKGRASARHSDVHALSGCTPAIRAPQDG